MAKAKKIRKAKVLKLPRQSVKRLTAANEALREMIRGQAEVIKQLRDNQYAAEAEEVTEWVMNKSPGIPTDQMVFEHRGTETGRLSAGSPVNECNHPKPATNPKTLMGQSKVPMLSVIPPASLIY